MNVFHYPCYPHVFQDLCSKRLTRFLYGFQDRPIPYIAAANDDPGFLPFAFHLARKQRCNPHSPGALDDLMVTGMQK